MRLVMKVLFLCTENSARSIMAEALMRHHQKGQYEVYSAGSEPIGINPNAISALEHFGLNAQGLVSKSIDDVSDIEFDFVITLCDKAKQKCQSKVNGKQMIAWDFPEPALRKELNPYEKTLQELNERIKMFLLVQEKQQAPKLTPTLFYKALADDTRLKTLLIIAVEQEVCVCELMTALAEESQPKVSRHLAQLRKAGILTDRKHQQWVFYSLSPELPAWMKQTITSTVMNEPNFIESELARLNEMGDRPTRVANCCN